MVCDLASEFVRSLARLFVGTHRFPAENAEFIGNWRGSHNSRLGLTLMPPLLRASQIGKGVKLTATYLWRGRDAIRHEDSGFARSRGCGEPALPTIYFAIIGPDVNIWPRPSSRRTTSILEGTSPNPSHTRTPTTTSSVTLVSMDRIVESGRVLRKVQYLRSAERHEVKACRKIFWAIRRDKNYMLINSFFI